MSIHNAPVRMAFCKDSFPTWTPAAREEQGCSAGDGKKALVFLLIPGLFYFQLLTRRPVACCGTAWCGAWLLSGLGSAGWCPSSAAWTRGWSPPALRGARTSGGSGATRSVGGLSLGLPPPLDALCLQHRGKGGHALKDHPCPGHRAPPDSKVKEEMEGTEAMVSRC